MNNMQETVTSLQRQALRVVMKINDQVAGGCTVVGVSNGAFKVSLRCPLCRDVFPSSVRAITAAEKMGGYFTCNNCKLADRSPDTPQPIIIESTP